MTETTALDQAHADMAENAESDTARLQFFERLADSELFLLLAEEAAGEHITPQVFDLDDGRFVLVFDREARLTEFVGAAAPYAALSGRTIVQMLDGQGIGLAVNLDIAPSSILIPDRAVSWLADTVSLVPDAVETRLDAFEAPQGLPPDFLTGLDAKLATASGLAQAAYLVAVAYPGGGRGHLLGFLSAIPGAEPALAQAVNEALTFSGIDAGSIDVGFFGEGDPAAARLAQIGLRFDLPVPDNPGTVVPTAPGSDPDRPPKLR